ncbi:hypothetical protein [Brevibacillus sp. SYSU BS000544]|uniref:hypothetical protein n=1 Tax=Brevibacillus sp. SYSU BS000544 TaxID=3416443 RepID=UPI003CE52B29
MKSVTSKFVIEKLNITERTFRNYCTLLERSGHAFEKDNQGKRLFSPHDIQIITEMITIKEDQKVSFEEAALVAIKKREQIQGEGEIAGYQTTDSGAENKSSNTEIAQLIQEIDSLLLNPTLPLHLYRHPGSALDQLFSQWKGIKAKYSSENR